MKHQTLKNLEALERDLLRLQGRREELAGEHERATAAAVSAQSAFIKGTANASAIADAGARAASLKAALDSLDGVIADKTREVEAAREAWRIESGKAKLIELAGAATTARKDYEAKFQALDALLQQHAPGVLEALNSWGSIQRQWESLARQLAPAFLRNHGNLSAAEIQNRQQEAESLLREIGAAANTADVRADIGVVRHDFVVPYAFPDSEFAGVVLAAQQIADNRPESQGDESLPKAA